MIEWKEMFGFPKYEINQIGEIRNAKSSRLVKQNLDNRGYMSVRIYRGNDKCTRRVAKLLWETFNDCRCMKAVDHIDRDKLNNTIENLRCIDWRENSRNRDSYDRGNKYSLTLELKEEIAKKYRSGELSLTGIMRQYGIPVNYTSVMLRRGSWEKQTNDKKGI